MLAGVVLWGFAVGCTSRAPEPASALAAALESIRDPTRVPALAVAVVHEGQVTEIAAVGTRRLGVDDPVAESDAWHLGSDTKAMTATLVALLVEDGVVRWDTTLAQAFPARTADMHPDLRAVTVDQLLTHRAGLPADLLALPELWGPLWERGDPREQRATFVAQVTRRAPETPPGTATVYANAGYIVAGAVLEVATGRAWEDLVVERLFRPLGMDGCGFGAPARKPPGPWGHRVGPDGALVPVNPRSVGADNPPAFGPAGTVHCPLRGWAPFVAAHIAGARGDTSFLPERAWSHLHTPPEGSDYAFGWTVTERRWAPGPVLTHRGSNTMFFATVWASPTQDTAWLAATNAGTDDAFRAIDTAVRQLATR